MLDLKVSNCMSCGLVWL